VTGSVNEGVPAGSILARTARGAGWVVAWRILTRVLGLGSTLVLVRILSPADFGLVALATAFAMALDVCLAIGVEDQIVRTRNPRRALYDTAFTLNLMRCIGVSTLIAAAAWPAGQFFGEPRLFEVLLALAFSALLSGGTNIGVVDFRRELSFDKEFKLQLLPRLVGITVTLVGAWLLQSHWALIIGILVNRFGIVVMSHLLHPYRPRLSLEAWRELVGISLWSWTISLASVMRDRADSIILGRQLGPAALGVYSVAGEVAALPTTEMVEPICRACMPGFAATLRTDDPHAVEHAYLRIIGLMALLTLPAGVGISLVSGPVVALAFGQAWLEAAPVMAILGIACSVAVAGNVSAAMLTARAALRTILAITLGAGVVRIALLLALVPPLGLLGGAIAAGIAIMLEHVALVGCVLWILRLSPWRLMRAVLRPALAAAVMALVLWGTGFGWTAPPASAAAATGMLVAAVPLGVVTYAVALLLFWVIAGRPPAAESDMLAMLRRVLAAGTRRLGTRVEA